MPVRAVCLTITVWAVMWGGGCKQANQYPNREPGSFSVEDPLPAERFQPTKIEPTVDADAPPVVKYLPADLEEPSQAVQTGSRRLAGTGPGQDD